MQVLPRGGGEFSVQQSLWREQRTAIIIGLLDVFTIGMGMGVPIFTILFGLPAGWYFGGKSITAQGTGEAPVPGEVARLPLATLRRPVAQSALLASATTAVLAILWLPQLPLVLDTALSATDWGIPLILFGSQASKVGWMVLMLVIAPVLQFMAAVTGAVLRQIVAMREPKAR